ncbi:MAG: DUF3592 domain-containing protein [Clostridiales bacterium]|nr:DUF3592 domain-containing protein [Clostridiales bacterium]
MSAKKMTDEQKELFEKSGAKNDWIVGLVFIIIFLAVIGINIFCRYNDNRKLKRLEHTQGVVTSRQTYKEKIGRKYHYEDSITVEYIPEGSDTKCYFRDSNGPYEFIHEGEKLGVYYEKDNPDKGFIAKTDWLTGKDVRADKNYNAAWIISVFPLGIGLFFFYEEYKVRKNIRNNKFKLRKSDGLYPNEDMHQITRMSNHKRSWTATWIGFTMLYVMFMAMGISWIVVSFTSKENDATGFLIVGIFVVLIAQGAALGNFLTIRSVMGKKRRFIKGFMDDDATLVYKDRQKAAKVLWKHVKHFMERENIRTRYRYDYSKLWLQKFEDELEKFRDKDIVKKKEVPFPPTNHIITHPDMWSDITVNEIPKYLGELAKKYNMHFKLIYDIDMAMFNDKCCLIFGIDNRDGVIMRMVIFENGRRVEYQVNNFLVSKFDSDDREGIDPEWNHLSQKIKDELIIIARGLDSKWSDLLKGDMGWFEDYKKSVWFHDINIHLEERNKILDEIIAWQQAQ